MRFNPLESISIDRRSTVSYSEQVKESIKSLILDQTFYYKTILPAPASLAAHLLIDQKLVETAYDQLVRDQYVKQNINRSYEVAYFELTNYFFYRNVAIYDAIIALGLTPSIQCLEKKIVTLDEKTLEKMGFKPHEKLFYINRIYKGNDVPIIILENYLPLSIFPEIDQKFVGNEPLNAYMDQNYDVHAKISSRVTKAVNLSEELAQYLGERKHSASIQSTNKVYDQFDRLIDYGQSHSRSSYYFQVLISQDEMKRFYQD